MRPLLLVFLAALAACSTAKIPVGTLPATPMSSPAIVVTGKLMNATPGDSVWIGYKEGATHHRVKTLLDATGQFQLVIQGVSKPISGQYAGPGGFITIFLSPGDSVSLVADRRHFLSSLYYSGQGSAANNYLAQAHRRFDNNRDSVPETLYLKEPATDYKRQVEARRQRQLAFMAAYAARQPLPVEFIRIRQQVIELQRAVSLLSYVHYAKKITKQEPVLPIGFLDAFRALPLSSLSYRGDVALLQATGELFMEYPYVKLLPPDGILPAGTDAAKQLFELATADFGDTPARDQLIGSLLIQQLYGPLVNDQKPVVAMLPLFRAHNRDSSAAQGIRRALQTTQFLRPGDLAPTFRLQEATGKRVSLQDFYGKVVYVDFWYSSCAPCIAEAPAAVKLKKQFIGRDVVFLYISVDRETQAWQQALARYPLTGPNSVHLIDPGGYKASAAYGVGAYPSYWIIGRDGRIYQGAAPRPSTGAEVVAALEQALAQKR